MPVVLAEVTFRSNGLPRYVIEPQRPITDQTGRVMGQTAGKTIEFEGSPGHGYFTTGDSQFIEHLRQHERNGLEFWEEAPVVPDSGRVLKTVQKMADDKNIDGLQAIQTEEKDGWERPDVLMACKIALAALGQKSDAR